MTNPAKEQKRNAQIEAARRCLFTNIFLMTFFIVEFLILILLVEKGNRQYYLSVLTTPVKAALPICTTIGNFGTVQFVIAEYYKYFQILLSQIRFLRN